MHFYFHYSKRPVFAWLQRKLCIRQQQKVPGKINSDAAEERALAERTFVDRSVAEELEGLALKRIASNAIAQLEAGMPESSDAIDEVAQPPVSLAITTTITSPPTPSAAPTTTPTATPSTIAVPTAVRRRSKKFSWLCCFG
jgi:hypothetical protein